MFQEILKHSFALTCLLSIVLLCLMLSVNSLLQECNVFYNLHVDFLGSVLTSHKLGFTFKDWYAYIELHLEYYLGRISVSTNTSAPMWFNVITEQFQRVWTK